MIIIAVLNALQVKKQCRWQAFIDTFLLDEFSYAHKYFKKGK
jgi:hypothetical protein